MKDFSLNMEKIKSTKMAALRTQRDRSKVWRQWQGSSYLVDSIPRTHLQTISSPYLGHFLTYPVYTLTLHMLALAQQWSVKIPAQPGLGAGVPCSGEADHMRHAAV